MNTFSIQAFFEQYPFVKAIPVGTWDGRPDEWCAQHGCTASGMHVHPTYLTTAEEVEVQRISPDFLGKKACYEGATGNLVDIRDDERIFLLSIQGELIGEVKQTSDIRHNEAHRDYEYEEGETVGEAVARVGAERVHYALSYHTGYEILDHHSVGGSRVTLYKPPRGFTLAGWVTEQLLRERHQIAARAAAIDADGTPAEGGAS